MSVFASPVLDSHALAIERHTRAPTQKSTHTCTTCCVTYQIEVATPAELYNISFYLTWNEHTIHCPVCGNLVT
jgi:hypothetical protein